MRTQNVSTRLFRLFAAMIMFVMAFSQVTGGAQAEGTPPPGKERVNITQISLDEVQNYYGRLGDIKGPVGVVVELEDTPAALIYAQSSDAQAAALTVNQVDIIQQKQADFMKALQAKGVLPTELFRTQKVYNGIWLRVDVKDLEKLASVPGVKALHPIIPKTIDNTTSVPLIGAPQVWGGLSAALGEGITIGIIDTGIDYIHTNFGGTGIYVGQDYTTLDEAVNAFPTAKVVGGWDFAGDAYNADSTSTLYDPIPAPDPDPMDCYGHGSHVAGTAAGFGVNTDGTTYVEAGADTYAALKDLTSPAYIAKFRIGPGVAPKAELYSLRIFGCEGSTDLTEQAIEWAMDPNGDGDLSDHLDVINMSLGSSFGSEYDTSAVASNNAAQAGIVVVASSGNANDVYYITGAPAVARYAISVASSVDSGAVVSAFKVTAAPTMALGLYPASLAVFGPQSYAQSGALANASPANGCDPALATNSAYPLTGVSGKIALIDRGTCSFDVKVKNAQLGGALGVLIVNNVNTFPVTMGGSSASLDATITIPSMMTTLSVGTTLKANLLAGTVTVLLTNAYPNAVVMSDPTIVDTLSSFSSRGPARAGTLLKPDITAPGDTIFSTKSGSRNQGDNFSGTSMSSPHVAGVMALLKQIHPTWTVAELKALVMNTATNDLWTSTAHTAKHTPTRVGAGRVNAANAALSSVVAYNAADPGQVSLAFGEQAVLGTQSFVKSITINNTGVASAAYNVTFDSRYQANPGLTFTLLNASNTALSNPVTVPAGGTLEIKVKITADATALTRARDASIATGSRQRFSEGGGYVTLTSTGTNPTLRVPVHIAARPASAMSVAERRINLPAAATGTFSLTPTGTPVDTVDDKSMVSIMELLGTSPNEFSSSGTNDAADLHYIGATSDYPTYPFTDPNPAHPTASMYFGIATYGKWDTPSSVEFDVYIDVNEDGTDDYVVFNTNQGFFTGTTDDVMFTTYCNLATNLCDADYYTNGFSGATNINLFNNNVMVLPVGLTSIGLVDGVNTNFQFYVVSYSRDAPGAVDVSNIMSYDVAHQAFTAVDAAGSGMPMWADASAYSPTITYDKAAIAADHSKGLLLLHHHNAVNTAEVLTFTYKYFFPWIGK
jgi:subtilisin family serine protease